ncbi:MAG: hypothetical protein IIV90_07755 [Oscillospiraceae bacterium]|nr:hypothetical protein [Oscillospiraceae bacterium]
MLWSVKRSFLALYFSTPFCYNKTVIHLSYHSMQKDVLDNPLKMWQTMYGQKSAMQGEEEAPGALRGGETKPKPENARHNTP